MILDEKDLTEKQRKWLEASQKIGPGAMTKTEKRTLEELYAEMLPLEQQELARYIRETFGEKKPEDEQAQDPIERMAGKVWSSPSPGLRTAFSQHPKPRHSKA